MQIKIITLILLLYNFLSAEPNNYSNYSNAIIGGFNHAWFTGYDTPPVDEYNPDLTYTERTVVFAVIHILLLPITG